LSGVSIIVKGKITGTQTNTNGEFSIEASDNDVLVFSFANYVSQAVKVSTASYVVIEMKTNATKLDEVVVVGYGTQKRNELTGAVSTVNTSAFAHSPSSNVATALQGTVPGLRVQQSTGQPGSSPSLAFRGGTNFDGSGTPLFVVDGMIMSGLYG
jgi:outer membrane receptor for Fe3+-dicitrate